MTKKQLLQIPEYRNLYMKYLGCLNVLANVAVYINDQDCDGLKESLDMALDDAESFFPDTIRINRILESRELILI